MELDYSFQHGFTAFVTAFAVAIVFLVLFKMIYSMITPHKEWDLIKSGNTSAAIGFSGALVGFALALASAANGSSSLLDFVKWGGIAVVAQLVAYMVARFLFLDQISKRIENNELSAGVILAGVSVAMGILNAACMSY